MCEACAKFELVNLGFLGTAYKPWGRPGDKARQKRARGKLLDTGVLDHPVEEHVTRAQKTHKSPFDEANLPSVDVSIKFVTPRAETRKWFLWSTSNASFVFVMVLCFVLSKHVLIWCKASSCMIISRIRA
jgi:hypothetical protein